MLDGSQRSAIGRCFWIYEHEWEYYSRSLGEPFLIEDLLVYFDGEIIFVACFPLSGTQSVVQRDVLERVIHGREEFATAKAVNAWGLLAAPAELARGASRLARIGPEPKAEPGELSVDLREFSYETHPKAREARNSAANKGLSWALRERVEFGHKHLRLVENWVADHDVHPAHASIALRSLDYVSRPHVFVVEAMRDGELMGFSILSNPAPRKGVVLQSFAKRQPGGRVGDALSAGLVEAGRQLGMDILHRGYSASPSIDSFKRKWAAKRSGPDYTEAFFADSGAIRARISDGRFLWHQRVQLASASMR